MTLSPASEATVYGPVMKQIEVSTMPELIQAVGPNRRIHLNPGIYRFSNKYQQTEFVSWIDENNPTLIIKDVSNLQMIGSGLKSTMMVNDRCSAPFLDFQQAKQVRLQGIGFGRMLQNQTEPLDCDLGLRGRVEKANEVLTPQRDRLNQWHNLAEAIFTNKTRGIEVPEYTEALYTNVLEQVKSETRPIPSEQDLIQVRDHSIRPRLGQGFKLDGLKIFSEGGKQAQSVAFVYDRSHNLLTALDAQAHVILAVEAHNNTRFSWSQTPDWLMQHSIVPESNAPAPNGIYALGSVLKDNANAGESFGSHRILIRGGIPTQRQILLHSRDKKQTTEIPWTQDKNDENSRTLGCFLFQDYDLTLLANIIQGTRQPIALVIQGSYSKNLYSPEL